MHDADGSVYIRGTFTANVTRDQRWIGRDSFYVEHGDWFVLVSAALLAFSISLLGVTGLKPLPVTPRE